jgi:acyl-CoA thioester hydrolase
VASRHRTSRAVDHVSNIEIVRWLDRAAELHADSLGYSRQWLLDHGIMWFVARHEIDYLAEAFPDDELIIATWVRDLRKVKSWRDYLIIRPADQTVICRAATLWVLVDLATRRPCRIEREMADRFNPLVPNP